MKSVTSYRTGIRRRRGELWIELRILCLATQQFVVHEMKIQIPRAFPVPRNNQQ